MAKYPPFIPAGLTIQELIDLLEDQPRKDIPVVFAYNYGDHWDTQVTQPVENAEFIKLQYSDYHNKWKVSEDVNENSYIDTALPSDQNYPYALVLSS